MRLLHRVGIAAKIGIGFGTLVLLLVLTGVVSYRSFQTASRDFVEYRQLARQNNALGRLQANMVEIRLHALKYEVEGREEAVREVRARVDNLPNLIREARTLFDDREALGVLNGVEADSHAYAAAFFEIVAMGAKGGGLTAVLAAGSRSQATLESLGPAVDAAIERMKLANLARQDTLGPRANAEVRRAAETTLVVSLITILVGLVAAIAVSAAITRPMTSITAATSRLAEGDLDVDIPARDHRGEVGAMARALQVFKEALQRIDHQRFLRVQIAEISVALQLADSPETFATALLTRLAPLLDAGLGLFYIRTEEGGRFRVAGGYACEAEVARQRSFGPGEGLPGQCVADRRTIIVSGLPADSQIIGSGLTAGRPDMVACVPVTTEEGTLGVIEIARYGALTELQRELLDQVAPVVALNLGLLLRNLRTSRLLEQTSAQAEELRVQAEELQASEDQLRIQREELQAANDALEDKTRSLQRQAAELEASRHEADRRAAEVASASEYKTQFLANMSHELRTPLNSILILAKALADNEQGNLAEEQVESVTMIGESGNHLLALINDILDLSKIEAGKLDLVPEDFRLDEVLGYVRRVFTAEARKKEIGLDLDIAAAMPAVVHADRQRFTQVLINLVANAVKFTDRGGVLITAEPRDAMLCFTVRDTGIGIPADRADHIFGAFHQLDGTTSRRYGGTGLGLAICKSLVELMGGTIAVTSTPGAGSAFSFTLPLSAGRDNSRLRALLPAQSLGGLPEGLGAGQAVLVVEADQRLEAMLARLIRSLGFTFVGAASGEAAVALVAHERPAAILLDLDLPDVAGLDVLRRLKAHPEGAVVPIYVMSADDSVAGVAKTLGAMGRIAKPLKRDEVMVALTAMIGPVRSTAHHRRLLVVEDSAIDAMALEKLFRPDAIEIVIARTGEEAVHRLTDGRYDAVILDLMLPDMSGFALLERVWSEPGDHPPVIIYSAHELSAEDIYQLRNFAESVVIKGRTSSRLREEVLQAIEEPYADGGVAGVPGNPVRPKGGRLLLVDDDVRNLVALSKALRGRGFNVEVASDGCKALALLGAGDFDAVLTDIMMPGMDGYELIRQLRARSAELPIIAVTAKAMKGDAELCIQAGANGYLAKPLDLDRLMEVLDRWLG